MKSTGQGHINASSNVFTKRTLNGKEYLVAPVTAIREGVYLYPRANGKGVKREYLPAEEIANTATKWEDKPLTLEHPTNENGVPGLISDADTTHTEVGLFRDVVNNDDKLGGNVWIEVEEIGGHGGTLRGVVRRANNGRPVDVSTGYAASTDYERGKYNGSRYTYVQRSPKPDHLALLPDNEGNCSVEDGCGVGKKPNIRNVGDGVRVNHRTILNVRQTARTPTYDGTETTSEQSWGDVPKTLTHFADELGLEYDGETPSVDGFSQSERSQIAELTLLGSVNADTARELMMFPVVNPSNNNLSEGALIAVMGGRGQSADISADAYDSASNEAERLFDEHFDESDRENAEVVSADFTVEGTVDPDVIDDAKMKLESLDGIRAHRSPGNMNPVVHVVAFPIQTDPIINYRMAFSRAFNGTPFEVGDVFENAFSSLPGGDDSEVTNNVGRRPDTTIGDGDEGVQSDSVTGEFRQLLGKLNRLVGGSDIEHNSDPEIDEILNDDDTTEDTMKEREKLVNEITEHSDITAESLEGMGDSCLRTTHDNIVPDDGESGTENGDDDVTNEVAEELAEEVSELRETVNKLKDDLQADKREKNEQLNDRLEAETDLGEEAIEGMSIEAKENVLQELGEPEENETEARPNMAGFPGEQSVDFEDDDLDVPVAGSRTNGSE